MKLYYAPTSPYSRKVRITALEKAVELENIQVSPYEDNPDLLAANPLSAVPTLVTAEGKSLYDSRVICAWLDSLSQDPELIPEGPERWEILRGEALCDGILDAAFLLVMERRRPENEQSEHWKKRRQSAISRSINLVESKINIFEGDISCAQIALGSALGYIDFRLPDVNWREGHPKTDAWFSTFSKRPSMQHTDPAL